MLERVDGPSDWISSLVIETKKDGSLRLCIDPRPLNKALKRCRYPMPIPDDVLPKLTRAKVFSVLDLKSGYWQVQLDDSSSQLTTMGTPFGRFRWKRMPFGIAPAPEIFQEKLDEVLSGLEGVKAVVDDILVYGEGDTIEEAESNHDRRLISLLLAARTHNLRFNAVKFKFRQKEVPFVGHKFTDKGLQVHSDKVAAIATCQNRTTSQL